MPISKTRLLEKLLAYPKFVEIGALQTWIASLILGVSYATETFRGVTDLLHLSEGFFGLFLILCYVMAINDYFDLEIDRMKSLFTKQIDKSLLSKKGQVVGEAISIREAKAFIVLALIAGLALSLLASVHMLLVTSLIVLLGTFYSVPPIRYKEIYPFSTIGDIAGGALPFLAGYAIMSMVSLDAVLVSIIPLLVCAYGRLKHEILMVEFDRVTGKKTLSVVHGTEIAKTLRRACPVLILLEILAIYFIGWFPNLFWLILFSFFFMSFGFWLPLIPKSIRRVVGALWSFVFTIAITLIILQL